MGSHGYEQVPGVGPPELELWVHQAVTGTPLPCVPISCEGHSSSDVMRRVRGLSNIRKVLRAVNPYSKHFLVCARSIGSYMEN